MVVGAGSSVRATGEGTTQVQAGVHGDHLGEDLKNLLGDGLVIDGDQILGLGVDLEGLVESNGSLDLVVTCMLGKEMSRLAFIMCRGPPRHGATF